MKKLRLKEVHQIESEVGGTAFNTYILMISVRAAGQAMYKGKTIHLTKRPWRELSRKTGFNNYFTITLFQKGVELSGWNQGCFQTEEISQAMTQR